MEYLHSQLHLRFSKCSVLVRLLAFCVHISKPFVIVSVEYEGTTFSALTTQSGRVFHQFITYCEKKLSLSCKRHLGLRIFNLWPLQESLKNLSALISPGILKIL